MTLPSAGLLHPQPVTRLDADAVIVGAGVTGLAIARSLARYCHDGNDILLLERHPGFGEEGSSRSSEVIHAGLYYPPGSLKAQHCLRGRELLYEHCRQHGVPFRRIGKLIVADEQEHPSLQALHENALASGMAEQELQWVDRKTLTYMEPSVAADHALFSPHSGIIDSHALMRSLLDEALGMGVTWSPLTRVDRVLTTPDGAFEIHAVSGSHREPVRLRCRVLINAAGLGAAELARQIEGLDKKTVPALRLVKGQYFSWSGPSPFRHLIYPLPPADGDGLGIHATLDLAGRLRFGPDTEPLASGPPPDYHVDESRREGFVEAVARYYPEVEASRLIPDYAGVRVKALSNDFVIQDGSTQGLGGLVQLFGIESPGLTAALSIAETVDGLIADRLTRCGYTPR